MRRPILLAFAAVPLAAIGFFYGCSSEPPVEDFCAFLANTENCFREFHEDLPLACGARATDTGAPAAVQGTFANREMLDTCVLYQGGSIKLDPPPDPAKFPPAGPLKITILDPLGNECGTINRTSQFSFTFTVNPVPDGGAFDAGMVDDNETPIRAGTISVTTPDGRNSLDIACANSAETHHFDRLQVDNTAGGCPAFAGIIPQAILDADPGSIAHDGVLRLTIQYPPPDDTALTDTKGNVAVPLDANKQIPPDKIVYFECVIPGAPKSCEDQAKNGQETDVDCGGSSDQTACPARCLEGQGCLCDSDCAGGTICAVDAKSGLRRCTPVGDAGPTTGIACKSGQACCTTSQCATGLKCEGPAAFGGTGHCIDPAKTPGLTEGTYCTGM